MSFCGVTVTANKLANLPTAEPPAVPPRAPAACCRDGGPGSRAMRAAALLSCAVALAAGQDDATLTGVQTISINEQGNGWFRSVSSKRQDVRSRACMLSLPSLSRPQRQHHHAAPPARQPWR